MGLGELKLFAQNLWWMSRCLFVRAFNKLKLMANSEHPPQQGGLNDTQVRPWLNML